MRKFIISALVAGAAFSAMPAAAQSYGYPAARQVQSEISQLANRINVAQQRGTISPREAQGLRRQAVTVQRNYRSYSRNGLTRREVTVLQNQVATIRNNLRVERRDRDGRRG